MFCDSIVPEIPLLTYLVDSKMNILLIFHTFNAFIVPSWAVTFDVVYYQQRPFLHTSDGILKGIIADISNRTRELCNISLNFKYDTETSQNFNETLTNATKRENFTDRNVMWLSLHSDIGLSVLRETNLISVKLFDSPGIEVVVHQDQIGILKKFKTGLFRCGYLLVLGIMLATVFAVLIWMIVSIFNFDSYSLVFIRNNKKSLII